LSCKTNHFVAINKYINIQSLITHKVTNLELRNPHLYEQVVKFSYQLQSEIHTACQKYCPNKIWFDLGLLAVCKTNTESADEGSRLLQVTP